MYHQFYQLTQDPFADAPDPDFLFLGPSHQAVLQAISNGLEAPQGGVVIFGTAGLGKTTLLQAYLARVQPQQVKAISLSFRDDVLYSNLSFQDILERMYQAFGLEWPTDDQTGMIRRIYQVLQVLLEEHTHGRRVVLLVDQAHLIPVQTLEDLLMLATLETTAGEPLLRLVFAGLPALQHTLNRPELRLLKKRLATRLTLVPLTSKESLAYLHHRLAKVFPAAADGLFTPGALKTISRCARGNPRRLHVLCANALSTGALYEQKRITAAFAAKVSAELRGKSFRLRRWAGVCAAGLLLAGVVWSANSGYLRLVTGENLELAHLPRLIASALRGLQEDWGSEVASTVAPYQPSIPPPPAAEPEVHAAVVAPEREATPPVTTVPVVPPEPVRTANSAITSGVQKDALLEAAATSTPPTMSSGTSSRVAEGQKEQTKPAGPSTMTSLEPQAPSRLQPHAPPLAEPEVHAAVVAPTPQATAPVTAVPVVPPEPVRGAKSPVTGEIRGGVLPEKALETLGETTETDRKILPAGIPTAAVPPHVLRLERPPLEGAPRPEVLSYLAGRGRTIYAVGFSRDGRYLSWGHTPDAPAPHTPGPLEHRFDLMQLVRLPGGLPEATTIRAQVRRGALTLMTERGGPYDAPYRLHVRRGQQRLSTVEWGDTDGYRHSAYTFTPDGQGVLSGGVNGVLRLYTLNGQLRATLVGHTGEIKAVAVSADGRWAVSGADDQTLRLWPLAALPEVGSTKLTPTLTLFLAIDGEWVAWTPEGFFAASTHGAHLLGYSMSQGLNKVATYLPAEELRDRFYRPELILTRLYGDLHKQPYGVAR